jgi:hypothetical protein
VGIGVFESFFDESDFNIELITDLLGRIPCIAIFDNVVDGDSVAFESRSPAHLLVFDDMVSHICWLDGTREC